MEIESAPGAARTPLHLWIVGVLALLWNSFGAVDYVMTRTRNEAYLKAMMPEINPATVYAYVDTMPLAAQIGWGFGVWGALVGTLLLLARSRYATWAYLASLIGAIVSFGIEFFAGDPPEGMDSGFMPVVITAIALALFLYARAMAAKGVLR